MATVDFSIKAGDNEPLLTDSLTYSDGSAVDLTGASVNFVMRQLSQATYTTLAAASITNASVGAIQYQFTSTDSAIAGLYNGNWIVTFPSSQLMTFPTVGYLGISIEENLISPDIPLLVSLADAKEVLNMDANDRVHDAKIIRFINACEVIIESIVGPVIPRIHEEWHDGGQYFIQVRRRPSSALGTSPIMTLMAASEYRGPIEYACALIQDPSFGSVYSAMLDTQGTVTRRSAGGGIIAWPSMPRSVHIWYQAGQQTVPWNIYEGTLELLREHYQQSQQSARGRPNASVDEETATQQYVGFLVSGKVRQWLAPTRRHPSIA